MSCQLQDKRDEYGTDLLLYTQSDVWCCVFGVAAAAAAAVSKC